MREVPARTTGINEANTWRGLLDWLAENPDHSDQDEVHKHLRESQDECIGYMREYVGRVIYVLQKF